MTEHEQPIEVGEAVIDRLGAHEGVEYVFGTFGTDHPPLIKGLANSDALTPITAPDERIAVSAAHGYAQVTGDPQAVLVHVDVGTGNLVTGLHNAARGRIPMFVMAGRTPRTPRGETPGSRSIFVHWYQDVYDQPGLVREYTKWEYELEIGANAERVVDRGLDVATAPPSGPVYLTLPREVLRKASDADSETATESTPDPAANTETTLASERKADLLSLLQNATQPLLITTYFGRDSSAVDTLVSFAETVGVPVVETAPAFHLNFPRDHPLHLGFQAEPYLDDADVVLVADCDVPWIPDHATPREDATVVWIDADPAKELYPLPDFRADHRIRADTRSVLADLTAAFDAADADGRDDRIERFEKQHDEQRNEWESTRSDSADADFITPAVLSDAIAKAIDSETIVVDETVTGTPAILRHLPRTEPGTYYSYCSSGLGWGLGASIGIRLARPDATVVTVVGDGSFVLGNPLAALQTIQAYDLPHLTVVYNNQKWQAVGDAVRDQYGDPQFEYDSFMEFNPGLSFADAADGMGCHAEQVTEPADLEKALEQALDAVADGTHALVEVETQRDEP